MFDTVGVPDEVVPRQAVERLTQRELEVLQAVARRLTNLEIAEEFCVSVRTVESHVAALRRKLAAESRRELIEAAPTYLGRPVPASVDSFVGRDALVAEARALLGTSRLLTLSGPAGVGKSRLAFELVGEVPSVVVELDRAEPGTVLSALASALGLEETRPESRLDACAFALAPGQVTLVVDNADRVAGEVVGVARALLGRIAGLRIVATCRAPMHAPGEVVVQVDPLPAETPEDAAIQLFVDRATAASRSCDLSDQALLTEVCQRLEGLPLAIELAAARTRHLSLSELHARLGEGFAMLGTPGHPVDRHAALGSAFAWSWDLLDDRLRQVLVHLAALPGSFDLDLAAAAVGARVDAEVIELVDRSLLATSTPEAPSSRFRMLASLREFLADKMPTGVVEVVTERHARHHESVARTLAAKARVDDSPQTRRLAHAACPEVSAALAWAVRHGDAMAGTLAEAVAIGSEQYGLEPGATDGLVAAVEDARFAGHWSATALAAFGRVLAYTHLGLVARMAERCRALAEVSGDDTDALAAAELTGRHLLYVGKPCEAIAPLQEAERLAVLLGRDWELAAALQLRGAAMHRGGDHPLGDALAVLEQARAAYAAAGDAMHVNNVRYMMALAAADSPDPDRKRQAGQWAEQCLAYAQRQGNQVEIGHARRAAAKASLSDGRADLAEAVRDFRRSGDLRCLSATLVDLAAVSPQDAEALLVDAVDSGAASGDQRCHLSAVSALAVLLWERGRADEAIARLGAAARDLSPADLEPLVPPELAAELGWSG